MKLRLWIVRALARALRIDARAALAKSMGGDVAERVAAFRSIALMADVPLGMLSESPWLRVQDLDDSPTKAYVWTLGPSQTDDRVSFLDAINSAYIRARGQEPLALHLVVRHPVDLRELTPGEVRAIIKPWLDNATKDGAKP